MGYLEDTKQNKPKNEGELTRIIFESLAFKYRMVIEQLEDLTGLNFDQINVVGGGSRNWLLNQLTADFTGLVVVAGPVEATSVGNILMQAVAAGLLKTHEDVRSVVRNSSELKEYQPNPSAEVDDAYKQFVALVERQGESTRGTA